ncbi:hypothetical protein E4U30_006588 [Claviceps sp. LM220 group G6]|nr:hypothetical protein E4U30_006588 [Claviceps sp. LM220 group G6]
MYGAPTHRLEEYMSMSSRALEIEGIDLRKLQGVHDINMDVAHDRHGVEEATRRLDVALDRRPKFQVRSLALTYGLASAFKFLGPFAFEGRLIAGDEEKLTFDLEDS